MKLTKAEILAGLQLIAKGFPGNKPRDISGMAEALEVCQRGSEFDDRAHWLATCRECVLSAKFFPTISELVELAGKARRQIAEEQWALLREWAMRRGDAESWDAIAPKISEASRDAFRLIGGRSALQVANTFAEEKLKGQFIAIAMNPRLRPTIPEPERPATTEDLGDPEANAKGRATAAEVVRKIRDRTAQGRGMTRAGEVTPMRVDPRGDNMRRAEPF